MIDLDGRLVTDPAIRLLAIVALGPTADDDHGSKQPVKDLPVEPAVAEPAVEALHLRIPQWPAGIDENRAISRLSQPLLHLLGDELGAGVATQGASSNALFDRAFDHRHNIRVGRTSFSGGSHRGGRVREFKCKRRTRRVQSAGTVPYRRSIRPEAPLLHRNLRVSSWPCGQKRKKVTQEIRMNIDDIMEIEIEDVEMLSGDAKALHGEALEVLYGETMSSNVDCCWTQTASCPTHGSSCC